MFLSSPLRFMTFVQIVEFDWLSGRQKGLIFVKMLKNLLLRNNKEMKLKLGIHALDISFYINCVVFLFRSDKNSGCYGK